MNKRIANTAEVRAVSKDTRTIDVIASTPAKDSYGTVIDQSGWVLTDFLRNPVITWAHDDRGFTASGGRPIAKALTEHIRVEDGKLKMRLKFPDKGKFRFADEVFDLLADGFLNAVSVGFEPLDEPEMVMNDTGEEVPTFRRQKLLEVAVVTIPSNSETLVDRAKELNRDAKEMRMRAKTVEKMAEEIEKNEEEKKAAKDEMVLVDTAPGEVGEFTKEEAEQIEKERAGEVEDEETEDEEKTEEEETSEEETETEEEQTEEDERKYKEYYEKKQPINRAATKVLEKFFKRILKEKPPADEIEAWTRMAEVLDDLAEELKEDEETVTDTAVGKVEVEVNEDAPKTETEEAPQPEQKASVQISLKALGKLSESLRETCAAAAVKASRKGVPIKDLDDTIDATGETFYRTLFPNQPK